MQPNNHPPYRFLFPGASAMISKAAISRNYCIGSLTIAHEHEMGNLEYVILKNKDCQTLTTTKILVFLVYHQGVRI